MACCLCATVFIIQDDLSQNHAVFVIRLNPKRWAPSVCEHRQQRRRWRCVKAHCLILFIFRAVGWRWQLRCVCTGCVRVCVCVCVLAPSVCCHGNMEFRHLTCCCSVSCRRLETPPAAEPVFTTVSSFCRVEEDDLFAVIFSINES